MQSARFTSLWRWYGTARLISFATLALLALLWLPPYPQARAMSQTPAHLGSISGMLTEANGLALANMEVRLDAITGGYGSITTHTDANGAYQLGLLAPGSYLLRWHDPQSRYATQWYPHSVTTAQATLLTVAGNQLTASDVLTLGGHLTGTVTVQQAGPAAQGTVDFYVQYAGQWLVVSTTEISQTGQYVSDALLPNTYRLCARYTVKLTGHTLTGCYGGPDVAQATDVVLAGVVNQANLSLDIGGEAFNSVVSGLVTGDGAPQAGIQVTIYNYPVHLGKLVSALTDSTGRYTIGGLGAGTYYLGFSDPAGLYETTYYTHLQFLSDAPAIALQENQVITTLNMTLAHGGRLCGHVQRYTGAPVASLPITLLQKGTANGNPGWHLTELATTTDADGNYTLPGLWPSIYRVGVQCKSTADVQCTEYYGSKQNILTATDVVVQADQTTAGIDLTLGLEHPVFFPFVQRP